MIDGASPLSTILTEARPWFRQQ